MKRDLEKKDIVAIVCFVALFIGIVLLCVLCPVKSEPRYWYSENEIEIKAESIGIAQDLVKQNYQGYEIEFGSYRAECYDDEKVVYVVGDVNIYNCTVRYNAIIEYGDDNSRTVKYFNMEEK